ncbi:restriction endonuclease subunit S [Candidatus Palauibacter sp.]|uniref:restriction endonuclease subunit S n=1 Tax=Candidatus Palauibacter sp. TaxID=3101350 RepID=UPI003B5294F0
MLAFGSRATWTAKDYSDLDLAVMGEEPLSLRTVSALDEALGDSDLPFKVDVVDWARIDDSFRSVIRRHAVAVQVQTGSKEIDPVRRSLPDSRTLGMATNCLGETTIGALLAHDGGNVKTGPFGTTLKAKEYSKEGVPLISVGEIGYGALRIKESTPRAPPEVVERLPEYVLQAGDIVFGRKGAVDRLAMVKPEQAGWFLGSDGIRLRLPSTCDARFVAYQLQGHEARSWLLQHATGTTMASLNQSTIERLPIVLPPLPEQRAIAHILGTLDDKIELNRRMNETLEAMARALFKSWFVDFDPVRAKMEGRDTGLPPDIADLFPDRLVDYEMGEIPHGWKVGRLADAIELLSGGTPKTSVAEYWNGGIPWYTPRDAPHQSDVFVIDTQRTITQAGVDNSATKVLPSRTTVISARGTVGRLACLGRPMAMNQTCYGIRGAAGYSDFFTYGLVRNTVEELRSRTHGTVFDTITRQTFASIGSLLPPTDVAGEFEAAVKGIMDRVLSNIHEYRTLAALRDTLLPKLISGEIRVPDAERALEAAT